MVAEWRKKMCVVESDPAELKNRWITFYLPLRSRLSGPRHGFSDIFTWALAVHEAQSAMRFGISLVGRLSIPHCGPLVALRNPSALEVHEAQVELRVGISLVRQLSIPHQGLLVALRHPSAAFRYHTRASL